MSIGLSNSEMNQMRRCPRKWYLGTYRRLKPRVDPEAGTALSIGNLVHDALANYYDPTTQGDPTVYVQEKLAEAIAESPQTATALKKEGELVEAMIGGYMEWLTETGADAELKMLGSERMVRVPLRYADGSEVGVHLLSKLDAPVERISDGKRLSLEHKTVGALDQPLLGLRIDAQLLTEHLAAFLDAMERGASAEDAFNECEGILYNMLRKVKRTAAAKPPFYGRVEITHNIAELRNHWTHVVAVAAKIADATARLDAGESHHSVCPPTPIPDRCKWECQFFRVCPLADDGSDFEGALDAIFEEHDPLERYDGAEAL